MSPKGPVEDGWFYVAVQALVRLAGSESSCSSATIAQDVDAHAVFLRRVLAQLVRAEIVSAREGRAGGYRLARPASLITLAEIYAAVKLAGAAEDCESTSCTLALKTNVGVQVTLDGISAEIEQRKVEVLGRYSLADVIERASSATRAAAAATFETGR
jgi:Rrf2 family transcriptional regulator, repressor of oqxAB